MKARASQTSIPPEHLTSVQAFMQRTAPLELQEEEPPLASSVMCSIFLLSCVLERTANRESERHGLTLPQWMALGCIGNCGPGGITHSDLCQRLMLSKAPVTGIVDRLVRDGYARRVPDEKDRRVSRIVIRSKGEAAWRRVRDSLRDHADRHCAGLSPDEQQTVVLLLARMLDSVARADPCLPDWDEKTT